jgi:hypothetical protein
MPVALYALLFCVIWRERGERGIAQSRVQEAAASCSVLCGDPGSWRNPQSRTPYPVMIVVNPVTLNSARNTTLPSVELCPQSFFQYAKGYKTQIPAFYCF